MKIHRKLRRLLIVCVTLLFLACGTVMAVSELTKKPSNHETVFLIHGLGRGRLSMSIMGHRLRHEGYRMVSFGYKSRKISIEKAVTELQSAVSNELTRANPPEKIHFVTHSLGGILVRGMLAKYHPPGLGHIVMLSPPNHGSEITDKLRGVALYRKLNGTAGMQLGTNRNSIPNQLPPADFSVGIITGDRSFNPIFSHWIPGKDDGKVSVKSAKLAGMTDFIVIHSSHTWIMNRKSTKNQVLTFLRSGHFKH